MEVFADPLAFLLLPLPLLARLLMPARATPGALAVPAAIAGRLEAGIASAARRDARFLALGGLAWILLVTALAGPQRVLPATALPASAHELMVVIDLSGSMETRDMVLNGEKVRRVEAVKAVAAEFMRRRVGDRIGLVLFAEHAEVAAVSTFDVEAVAETMEEAEIGALGRSTAIGDGLGLAIKRLRDSTTPNRVVVLLSDGTSTAGSVSAEDAAALARQLGIRVHTIALGTEEELSPTSVGVASLVDVRTLSAIAAISGGEGFRVSSTEDLEAVVAAIDALEGGRLEAPPTSVAEPLWPLPAAAAFVVLAGLVVLERRRP